MFENWVIDATLYHDDGYLCFVPVKNLEDNPTFVLGMNVLSDVENFELGNIVGIIHADGQEAVEKFCNKHPEILEAVKKRKEVKDEARWVC